jgi:ubiquinone biosynthesis protein COQ4
MTPRDLFLTLNAIRITMADSDRLDQIHLVEETTGRGAFRRIHARLEGTAEGRALLQQRPELNETQVDLAALRRLPRTSLGGAYVAHLDDNGLSAATQAVQTRYVEDPDLAYLVRRFRQTHDVWHPLVALGVAPHEEVLVHAFSFGQLHLPLSALVLLFGGLKHGLLEGRWGMLRHTLRDTYRAGRDAEDLIGVHWESMWETPLEAVRRRYRITPAVLS